MKYSNIRVLIADDMSVMRTLLKTFLRNMGIEQVYEAHDGAVALELLRKNQVDIILSDWNMPGMTGIELLKEVRQDPTLKHIPFIMVSAEATGESIAQAIHLKVSQYLIKPFTHAQLEQKMTLVLGRVCHGAE